MATRTREIQKESTEKTPATLPRVKGCDGGPVKADVAVIGAGPTGLACAIEAQKIGAIIRHLLEFGHRGHGTHPTR